MRRSCEVRPRAPLARLPCGDGGQMSPAVFIFLPSFPFTRFGARRRCHVHSRTGVAVFALGRDAPRVSHGSMTNGVPKVIVRHSPATSNNKEELMISPHNPHLFPRPPWRRLGAVALPPMTPHTASHGPHVKVPHTVTWHAPPQRSLPLGIM